MSADVEEAEAEREVSVLSRSGIDDVAAEKTVDRVHLKAQSFSARRERVREKIGAHPELPPCNAGAAFEEIDAAADIELEP
jgi:hypothetical protein